MKKSFLFGMVLGLSALSFGISHASNYVGGTLGWEQMQDSTASVLSGSGSDLDFEWDSGWTGSLYMGKRWNQWRGEFELSTRSQGIKDVTVKNTSAMSSGSGDMMMWSLMANLHHDFSSFDLAGYQVTPSLGGGLGFSRAELDNSSAGTAAINNSDTVFSYQVIAGLAWELNKHWDWTVDGRLFGASKPNFSADGGLEYEVDVMSYSVNMGVRYNF